LFAETSRRGGWRGAGDGDALVIDEHVDSAAVKMGETSQGGAPKKNREDRRERGMRGSPTVTESTGDACRVAGLRR
jgi:hypothetical protein